MNIINRFYEKISLLNGDFIGIRFDSWEFFISLQLVFVAVLFFLFLYLFGEKIRSIFFKQTDTWKEKHLINFALGYIFFGTGLTLIGLFSLLQPINIILYLSLILIVCIFPLRSFRKSFSRLIHAIQDMFTIVHHYKFWPKLCITLFLLLTFARLLPPEIGADAMNYHTTFPKLYLFYQTFILDPNIHVAPIAIPQLGEMPYILTVFFNVIDVSRYIHFGFYLLSVLVLLSPNFIKDNTLRFFVILLFVTSPTVLHYAPSAYSDFPSLFCFLLTILILLKEQIVNQKNIILAAIVFGGALATKAFAVLYFPSLVLFLVYKLYKTDKFSVRSAMMIILPFIIVSLLFPLPWYIYSLSLFGNPFSYYVYSVNSAQQSHVDLFSLFKNLFSWPKMLLQNLIFEYSQLFFIGLLCTVIYFKSVIKKISSSTAYVYAGIFTLIYLFYPSEVYAGRYFLPAFIIISILFAQGFLFIMRYSYSRYLLYSFIVLLFIYYSINTLAILPYGIGWADKDRYITRALILNGTAYYDFNNTFSKHIVEGEIIATFHMDQFYYANFIPNNIYYFMKGRETSFADIKKQNISKIMIRGGDINWLCREVKIAHCSSNDVTLLTYHAASKIYLYDIKESLQ